MQKRVVLVSAAVATLGVAAVVLGLIAESAKSKAFVGYIGERCVYRRTAALACGVAAALLALAAVGLVTAATGCFGRYGGGGGYATGRRRVATARLSVIAWVLVVVAAVMFLYGAAMNRGGTRGLSSSRQRGRRYGRYYYYGCAVVRSGVFASASAITAAATACAIAAYVYLRRQQADDETAPVVLGQYAAQGGGVAMGQPQWAAQPYPPPVGYPAPPPYGGYKQQPAGTA